MTTAYLNRVGTAVPPHDTHAAFVAFGEALFDGDERRRTLFQRMAQKAGIDHRYSFIAPAADLHGAVLDRDGFYVRGAFPTTAARMRFFNAHAPALAADAIERLELGAGRERITHLIVTCCTGFAAPGLDFEIVARCGLPGAVERTIIGFMGCYAAINGLKLARHIVRSDPRARVLVVSIELCTLHAQEAIALDQVISFLLWGDGCAAALVTAEPEGLALDSFRSVPIPETADLIQWHIGDTGFDMVLSGEVPLAIHRGLSASAGEILAGMAPAAIDLWAVHAAGRSVLDAVERAFALPPTALAASREVLRRYGNMSSATVVFVLDRLMRQARTGAAGCAMAFGPGMAAETMLFRAGR